MGDVEIFYAELNSASNAINTALTDLVTEAGDLYGDDTGIENPAQRTALRLEMHRRLTALHDSAVNRVEAASALSASITAIADRYSELDTELTGREH